jgi:hypothetical protein
VIGTIHGWPRPPIFGGPGTEHLSEYSGVLRGWRDPSVTHGDCEIDNTYTKWQHNIWEDYIDDLLPLLYRFGS